MSVLIVGSSGYLGSSLLHYLSSYLQTYSFSRRQVNDLPKTTFPLNDVSPSTLKRHSIGTIINCSGSDFSSLAVRRYKHINQTLLFPKAYQLNVLVVLSYSFLLLTLRSAVSILYC